MELQTRRNEVMKQNPCPWSTLNFFCSYFIKYRAVVCVSVTEVPKFTTVNYKYLFLTLPQIFLSVNELLFVFVNVGQIMKCRYCYSLLYRNN